MWIRTSPSLALVKYWGKKRGSLNRPATSSLAIGLEGFYSYCRVESGDFPEDRVLLDGITQPGERFRFFFSYLRTRLGLENIRFRAECINSFPTAAGLASSSSGFAALSAACLESLGMGEDRALLSELAGRGSASASRALWGGFTSLKAGALRAEPVLPASYWPELSILVAMVDRAPKPVSSREAMRRCRDESPGYRLWLRNSRHRYREAVDALYQKDLPRLGETMIASYSEMFSLMLTMNPPLVYWMPRSLEVIHFCRNLRSRGIGLWETMDAGPQVKIITRKKDLSLIRKEAERELPHVDFLQSSVGGEPARFSSLPQEIAL